MEDLRKEFKKIADEVVEPFAKLNDSNQSLAKEVIETLSNKGYLGLVVSKNYGGMELNMNETGIFIEQIGRVCSATRNLFTVHGMVQLAIQRYGTEEQKEYWLPKTITDECICAFALTEPEIGSDAKNIKMVAEKVKDGYLLNGEKKWITMGQIANLFLVFANIEGKTTAFLVDRECTGLEIEPINDMLGVRGSNVALLKFNDCFVSEKNILGRIGNGFNLVALSALNYGRYTVACGSLGLAQGCLDESLKYASTREQFGNKLKENQLIKKILTEMIVSTKASRALCVEAGNLYDSGDPEAIMSIWIAKYDATKTLTKIASDTVQIFGANGLSNDYKIERFYRDARVNEIIEGTTQMHEILIANYALNRI